MKKTSKKVLSIILSALLCIGVFPLTPITVFAEGTSAVKEIMFGTSAFENPTQNEVYEDSGLYYYTPNTYIYFGTLFEDGSMLQEDTYSPFKWRVLDADKSNTGLSDGVFILSEDAISKFTANTVTTWDESEFRNSCNSIASDTRYFAALEQVTMLGIEKKDVAETLYSYDFAETHIPAGDKLFFISAREVYDYIGYYNDSYTTASGGVENLILRSDLTSLECPIYFDSNGSIDKLVSMIPTLTSIIYADSRAATNLDKSKILFTSPAAGCKSTDSLGTLSAPADYTGNEWKLTLLDESRNFSISETKAVVDQYNRNVIINFSGANLGDNEYVSAMIVDDNDNVLYYGQLLKNTQSGILTLNIPDHLPLGNYKLKVFSEQINGDNFTDYASAFAEVNLKNIYRTETWIGVSEIEEPVNTEKPVYDGYSIENISDSYSEKSVYWYSSDTAPSSYEELMSIATQMPSDAVFTSGKYYTFLLNLKTKEGFGFPDNFSVDIIDNEATIYIEEYENYYEGFAYYTYYCDYPQVNHSNHRGFVKWTDSTSLPSEAGCYYLSNDVTLNNGGYGWFPVDGTVLCLNGHTIKNESTKRVIRIDSGVTFTLCDCSGDTGKVTVAGDGAIEVLAGGTFNMYGGTLTGSNCNHRGGGVDVQGTFNMYGGKITGNAMRLGGGVYVRNLDTTATQSAVFNMYGGEISDNTTTENGEAVYMEAGTTFNLYGGTISGSSSSDTSLIYTSENTSFTVGEKANFTIDEGKTLVNNGNVENNGIITNSGTFTNNGTFRNFGTYTENGTYEGNAPFDVGYIIDDTANSGLLFKVLAIDGTTGTGTVEVMKKGRGLSSQYSETSYIIPKTIASEGVSFTVTQIGNEAFLDCSSLKNIVIPYGVETIGDSAFQSTAIESLVLPDTVKSIGRYSFSDCTALSSVVFPMLNDFSIGDYAFHGCISLKDIDIPYNVTSIGAYAFSGCTSLENVTIPGQITSLEKYLFSGCTSLKTVTFTSSVNKIGFGTFQDCNALTDVYFYGTQEQWYAISVEDSNDSAPNANLHLCSNYTFQELTGSNLGYRVTGRDSATTGTVEVIGLPVAVTISTERNIPATVEKDEVTYTVTSIGARAFENETTMTAFTLPDTVKVIKPNAFNGCSSLIYVNLPNSLTYLGSSAFANCNIMDFGELTLPEGVAYIGANCFNGVGYNVVGSSLSSVVIPEGVKVIEQNTFYNCDYLTTVTLPESLLYIAPGAFHKSSGKCTVTDVYYYGTQEQRNALRIDNNSDVVSTILDANWHYVVDFTFDFNDRKTESVKVMVERDVNTNVAKIQPTIPTRDGFTFKGWYDAPEGGNQISDFVEVNAEKTFYAQWESVVGVDTESVLCSYNDLISYNIVGDNVKFQWYATNSETGSPATLVRGATKDTFSLTQYLAGKETKYKYFYCVATVTENGTTTKQTSKMCLNGLTLLQEADYSVIDYENKMIYTDCLNNVGSYAGIVSVADGGNENVTITVTPSYAYGTTKSYGTGSVVTIKGDVYSTDFTVIVFGDVNGDGVVDVLDATATSLASTGKTTLTGNYNTAADINGDGIVDVMDYSEVVNKSLS